MVEKMAQELVKQYDPKPIESRLYRTWDEAGVFQPGESAQHTQKKPFVIMLPPPNITGHLHIGHALQDVVMDILVRWHRMLGEPTLWMPGTDHAAIATNKVIENQLHEEGASRFEIGRDAFLKRTEEWYAKTGAEILNQMKRLGCSCDWSRNRFTMDAEYYKAVQEAFVRYFKKGYIYRGARIVNWDPKSKTTVSDLEIEWKDEKTSFYYFRYGPFEIGTSRPETKFGDKYVVMHPDDARYARYRHGDTFTAEWINGSVTATVVKDAAVDASFGTGVMTITPWHDAHDFEIAQRHNLAMEQIIDFDGRLLPIAGEFAGQEIMAARQKIVEKLAAKGLLVRIEKGYEHRVALNDRGKAVIEPQVMRQWFVDMKKLSKETISVIEGQLVQFFPPRWKKHVVEWMQNVHDWNINRQIWLGHRLPVWWKPGTHGTNHEEGNYVVSVEQPVDLAKRASGEGWQQDPDVLDTWFSSALWPLATLGWPSATDDLSKYYPTSVLVTAREILYLWVARMIFSGLEFMQGSEYGNRELDRRIPFKDVLIHPTVLNKRGQRMSKSLGTGVDPLELVELYGADALRFGLMYQMNYGSQAMRFDPESITSARNFINKVWNIGRLVLRLPERTSRCVADDWIEEKVRLCSERVTSLLGEYRIGEAARLMYDLTWRDFADWYLEIVKIEGSTVVARKMVERILIMLHPFIPFVTEELWVSVSGDGLLAVHPWVSPNSGAGGKTSPYSSMEQFIDVVSCVRSTRALLTLAPGSNVEIVLEKDMPFLHTSLEAMARAVIVQQTSQQGIRVPLKDGSAVVIASPEITRDRLASARRRLERERRAVEEVLSHTERTLKHMRGKASESAIISVQARLTNTQKRREEISSSIELLKS